MKTFYLLSLLLFLFHPSGSSQTVMRTGAENFLANSLELIKNKRVGVITNHTALVGRKIHLVDTLVKIATITALFGPEHGIRGDSPAGDHISDSKDPATGIPVFSLYGKNRKPTEEMLKNVDILIFDIQDVGARFYTYISTMYNCIETSAERNIPIIVLDRPNPLGGEQVEGPMIKQHFFSFVGITDLPISHGMTTGELAKYFNYKIEQYKKIKANLTIIPLTGWTRAGRPDYFNSDFVKPSPNLADFNSVLVYPGTCLIEATNVSEGRGTQTPFSAIGAPFIKSDELIKSLSSYNFHGVKVSPVTFTPSDIPGMSVNPKHKGVECNGISIKVTDQHAFLPVKFGLILISELKRLYPDDFKIRKESFYRLCGSDDIFTELESGNNPEQILKFYNAGIGDFYNLRKSFLIYQ